MQNKKCSKNIVTGKKSKLSDNPIILSRKKKIKKIFTVYLFQTIVVQVKKAEIITVILGKHLLLWTLAKKKILWNIIRYEQPKFCNFISIGMLQSPMLLIKKEVSAALVFGETNFRLLSV